MTELINNAGPESVKEAFHSPTSMRESLVSEAFAEAIRNSKANSGVDSHSKDTNRVGTSADGLPRLAIDDVAKDSGKQYTEKELSDAIKDAARNVLHEKGGLLDNLTPEQKQGATEMVHALAYDSTKGGQEGTKESSVSAMAKDGPDEFEQILSQGGRVVGALIGAIRGYKSGGLAGAARGAISGWLSGEQTAETARQLWRTLPAGARETVLGLINDIKQHFLRPIIRPLTR